MATKNQKTQGAKATGRTQKKSSKPNVPQSTENKIGENAVDKKAHQVSITRTVKYIYPDDCTTPLERKAFRSKIRAKMTRLEAALGKAKSNVAKSKARKALEAFTKETIA